jgi:ABC-type sugar transport system ATPase subunit
MSTLEFRSISKSYRGKAVLRDVTLTGGNNDFLVIFGAPSSGKSVLMRILVGLEKPDAGTVLLRDRNITSIDPGARNIGYCPQSFALYPHYSVRDNIAYPLSLMKTPKDEIASRVKRVSALLGLTEQQLGRKPDQLSGGQKQRVAIARGLVKQTDVYVLDDPLVGLDFKLRERLIDDLRVTQQELGVTFIYTTSDPVECMMLARTLAVLDNGAIIDTGTPERIYRQPRDARTMKLVGFPEANFIPGTLETIGTTLQCKTGLFEFPIHRTEHNPQFVVHGQKVLLGIRPEHVAIREATDGEVSVDAKVLLREDLGGEEIVYLDASGVTLSTVLRHSDGHTPEVQIDEHVRVAIDPGQITVFPS